MLGDEGMNTEQFNTGLAWLYYQYQVEQSTTDRVKLLDAEINARRHMHGLLVDREPVPPQDYRKTEHVKEEIMNPFTIRAKILGKTY